MTTLRKVSKVTLAEAVRVTDDQFPGFFLYSADQRIEGLPVCTTPKTWYVILRAQGSKLTQMLTEKVGYRAGWDTCGGCSKPVAKCDCAVMTPPPWIERVPDARPV